MHASPIDSPGWPTRSRVRMLPGVNVVAAAGNDGWRAGAASEVCLESFAVGASDDSGRLCAFSSRGVNWR